MTLQNYKKRIKQVNQLLSKQPIASAAIVETAKDKEYAGSEDYYLQDSNFFYLTGENLHPAILFFSNQIERPLLIAEKPDPKHIVWNGKMVTPKKLAESLELNLILVKEAGMLKLLLEKLKKHSQVFLSAKANNLSFLLAERLLTANTYLYPSTIAALDAILSKLRLYKDRKEITLIKKAIKITHKSLEQILPELISGNTEQKIAALLDYNIKIRAAQKAFPYIVATGKNAAILHYRDYHSALKPNEVIMIDCGAKYQGYSADITRCYPVDGKFSSPYQEIHQIVLSAQTAAIKKIKDGAKIKTVYLAATRELTIGLKELGVLKGHLSKLIQDKAYQPYFMHSIGHSLGIDTHDPGGHREGKNPVLKENMVFTIEPGLYFQKKTGNIPAGGIRIEDDILVTKDKGIIL